MASLPVGKNNDARPRPADHARDFKTIFVGVLYPAVRDVERIAPGSLQDARCFLGFAPAVVGRSTRAHLAARKIKDGGAMPAFSHFEQRAAASLLDVVAVGGDSENVN